MDSEDRIKEIDKEITKVGIIDAPGSIMIGLGLYAKFAANGNAFHPILNNQTVVNALLIFGTAIMIWGGSKIFSLIKEKTRLKNESNGRLN